MAAEASEQSHDVAADQWLAAGQAREAYRTTDLKAKLGRHHADPDSAFWGWNRIWLDPDFRSWSIEELLPQIRCPVLAIQGAEDEYGTMAQVDGIAARVPQAELLKLDRCRHSAHRDRPAEVIAAASDFLRRHGAGEGGSQPASR